VQNGHYPIARRSTASSHGCKGSVVLSFWPVLIANAVAVVMSLACMIAPYQMTLLKNASPVGIPNLLGAFQLAD
jgi:hypothetical protein